MLLKRMVLPIHKQLFNDGGTHHAHLGGLLDILLGKALAFFDCPQTDIEIVDRLSVHRCVGVVISVDGLSAGSYLGRHLGNELLLTNDTLVVGHLQCLHARWVLTHTATHVGTRADGEQVGTHSRQFGTDTLL